MVRVEVINKSGFTLMLEVLKLFLEQGRRIKNLALVIKVNLVWLTKMALGQLFEAVISLRVQQKISLYLLNVYNLWEKYRDHEKHWQWSSEQYSGGPNQGLKEWLSRRPWIFDVANQGEHRIDNDVATKSIVTT